MRVPSILRPVRERFLAPFGRPDQAERLLAETFRTLGTLCTRLADMVEQQRLTRAGYRDQGRFLERLDRTANSPEQK